MELKTTNLSYKFTPSSPFHTSLADYFQLISFPQLLFPPGLPRAVLEAHPISMPGQVSVRHLHFHAGSEI